MEIIHQKNSIIFSLLLFFLCFSCTKNTIISEYKTLKNQHWKSNEKINFSFEISDTILPKNLFINIRNTNKYEFSNLYMITELKFPNGLTVIDTLQYEMADATGKYLGAGSSNLKESKLFYKENKVFTQSGKYQLSIRHAMRRNGNVNPIELLSGIQDVGFSIEKMTK